MSVFQVALSGGDSSLWAKKNGEIGRGEVFVIVIYCSSNSITVANAMPAELRVYLNMHKAQTMHTEQHAKVR